VFGAIRAKRTWFAFVVVVLIVLGSFAHAIGRIDVSCSAARGTIFRARRTIRFGGFALFVQIRIDWTIFAFRFTFAILVFARRTRGTDTFFLAEFTYVALFTRCGTW
jgi:hypothetical protein